MSEAPAVSVPGFSGTVIESGINDGAAKAALTVTPTDTSGMSASQTAAMRFVDSAKPELLKGTSNPQLLTRNREALDHVFNGGPTPAWLEVAGVEAGAPRVVPDGELPGLAAAYEPMQEAEAGHLRASAGIYGVPPADADALTDFCVTAKIPATLADGIAKRAAHHFQARGSGEPMTTEEAAELHHEAARVLGGQEKYEALNAKARAYVESMGPEAVRFVDEKAGSLVFDPRILIALAGLADARGVKAN